jgi:hypothetical protein
MHRLLEQIVTFYGLLTVKFGAELILTQRKLIAANAALIDANEKLISMGEKPFIPVPPDEVA